MGNGLFRLASSFAIFVFVVSAASAATPCDGIDRSLTKQTKDVIAPAVIHQLNFHRIPETSALSHVSDIGILGSFRSGGWTILYVDPEVADEAYLFYAGDPAKNDFVALWAGTAMPDEEHNTLNWELKKMPGIPHPLAACFAWYVTEGEGG